MNNEYFIDLKSALNRSETLVESMIKSNKVIETENNRDIETVKSVKIKNFEELKVSKRINGNSFKDCVRHSIREGLYNQMAEGLRGGLDKRGRTTNI